VDGFERPGSACAGRGFSYGLSGKRFVSGHRFKRCRQAAWHDRGFSRWGRLALAAAAEAGCLLLVLDGMPEGMP